MYEKNELTSCRSQLVDRASRIPKLAGNFMYKKYQV